MAEERWTWEARSLRPAGITPAYASVCMCAFRIGQAGIGRQDDPVDHGGADRDLSTSRLLRARIARVSAPQQSHTCFRLPGQ